jgi:hypothetical protein
MFAAMRSLNSVENRVKRTLLSENLAAPAKKAGWFARRGLRLTRYRG